MMSKSTSCFIMMFMVFLLHPLNSGGSFSLIPRKLLNRIIRYISLGLASPLAARGPAFHNPSLNFLPFHLSRSNLLLLLADTSRLSTFPAHFAPVLLQTGSPDKVMGQWAGPSPPSPLVTAGQGSAQHTATPADHPPPPTCLTPHILLLPSQTSLSILPSCTSVRQVLRVQRWSGRRSF